MAYGHARATGRPAVFAVVPGPGILNASAALVTAHGSNTPVLALTGDGMWEFKDRGRRQLHEIADQLGVLRALTKWAGHVDHPTQAAEQVSFAFQQMMSGRRGATAVQTAWDCFTCVAPVRAPQVLPAVPNPPVDPAAIDRAARLIAGSRAPMIFVGSGAQGASQQVIALAEAIGAPVVSFRGGRGVVPDDHPLGYTVAAGQRLWRQTDLALVIGSRFELLDMRWRHRPADLQLIRVDIDPQEMHRLPATAHVVADAAEGALALLAALHKHGVPRRRDELLASTKAAAAAAVREIQPQVAYLEAIRDVLPREGFFVDEISQMGFAAMFGFPVYQPRTLVTSGHQGTLGFGFPTALGVKSAFPQRPVLSVTGDGGFLFAAQELATAVQYGLHVVTVVFNNDSYGNVHRDQLRQFEGRVLGCELVNPDFRALSESFGVPARVVRQPSELRAALEWAFAAGTPALIEVRVPRGSESDPWQLLMPQL
jgi:acetolactate synthase-1/2/3 large subunit